MYRYSCILCYYYLGSDASIVSIHFDSELAVSADFRDSPSFFRNKEFIEVLETSELSMLAFKNGGCFGEGMLLSLSVSM